MYNWIAITIATLISLAMNFAFAGPASGKSTHNLIRAAQSRVASQPSHPGDVFRDRGAVQGEEPVTFVIDGTDHPLNMYGERIDKRPSSVQTEDYDKSDDDFDDQFAG